MTDPFDNIDVRDIIDDIHVVSSVNKEEQFYEEFLHNNNADFIVNVECSFMDVSEKEKERGMTFMKAFVRQYADLFFPKHGELSEYWHFDEAREIAFSFMGQQSYNLKFCASNPRSLRDMIRGLYALSDALYCERLPRTAKTIHLFSKQCVKNLYEQNSDEMKTDRKLFSIYLPQKYNCEAFLFENGQISIASEASKYFFKEISYLSFVLDVYRIFPELTPQEREQQVTLACIDYILNHKEKYKYLIIK